MKNKKKIIALIFGSSSVIFLFFFIILISVLMILDFFGTTLTKEKVQSNSDYRVAYKESLNKYMKNGYVPLQRILYFYLEDNSLTFDTLYKLNQNDLSKTTKEIEDVCHDERVKNMVACNKKNIEENKDYLVVTTQHFNFPLDTTTYNITSFYNEERVIYGEKNVHSGWDFSASEGTPVYSICDGTVTQVNYTQNLNVPFDRSGNSVGNYITIKCDKDYAETYYVTFHHLYPNSSKVKVGDNVSHFTEVASVGTTGRSTGNHLHYSLFDSNMKLLDGMQFIDLNMKKPLDIRNKDWGKINPIIPQN